MAELRQKYIMDQKAIEDAGFGKGVKIGIKSEKRTIAKKIKTAKYSNFLKAVNCNEKALFVEFCDEKCFTI